MNRVGLRHEIRKVAVVGSRFFLAVFGATSIWCGVELLKKENGRLIQFGIQMLLVGLMLGG
ncbi:MAG: hypothetical protein IAG10_10085 [Planctomycetaceae bacterium]|nr:hypothetical protein [Planctomycetaceae bacterium]